MGLVKINPQNELGDIISGPPVALVNGTWHPVFLTVFMHFACFGSGGCAAKAIISYPWSMAHVNINLRSELGRLHGSHWEKRKNIKEET